MSKFSTFIAFASVLDLDMLGKLRIQEPALYGELDKLSEDLFGEPINDENAESIAGYAQRMKTVADVYQDEMKTFLKDRAASAEDNDGILVARLSVAFNSEDLDRDTLIADYPMLEKVVDGTIVNIAMLVKDDPAIARDVLNKLDAGDYQVDDEPVALRTGTSG